MKLVPLKVRVKEALLGAIEEGEMEVRAGRGFLGGLIMKERVLERPLFMLPECGLNVLTVAIPGVVINDCETVAVSQRMLLLASRTGVVVRVCPFHCITVPVTNPEPKAVIVKPWSPALALAGAMEARLAPVFC